LTLDEGKRQTSKLEIVSRSWNGISNPRSVTGGSALVEPTPHHIACDAVHVNFRADPDGIRHFLPPGMEPAEDPTGWVMVADMVKISVSEPDQYWRNPERSNYNECVMGFNVRFDGRDGRFSPLVWVNRDWSMGMGNIMGWGKRLATVERSRLNDVNPGLPTVGPGARAGGLVIRSGSTVLNMSVELDEDSEQLDALPSYGATTFLYRYLASPGPEIPAVDQLLELPLTNVKMADVWRGKPHLTLGDGDNEELARLGNLELLDGFLYRRGWTLDRSAKLVHDYTTNPL
jgi:acetoacetate decarboxylase